MLRFVEGNALCVNIAHNHHKERSCTRPNRNTIRADTKNHWLEIYSNKLNVESETKKRLDEKREWPGERHKQCHTRLTLRTRIHNNKKPVPVIKYQLMNV